MGKISPPEHYEILIKEKEYLRGFTSKPSYSLSNPTAQLIQSCANAKDWWLNLNLSVILTSQLHLVAERAIREDELLRSFWFMNGTFQLGPVTRRLNTKKSIWNISIIFMNLNFSSFKISIEKHLWYPIKFVIII